MPLHDPLEGGNEQGKIPVEAGISASGALRHATALIYFSVKKVYYSQLNNENSEWMQGEVNKTYWITNLRSFIILLVVLHHAAMAYTTYGYFDKEQYSRSTHVVIDKANWIGFDVFISFNDNFFMPLMFFISGLFFMDGLHRKGISGFVRDRTLRLVVPFASLGLLTAVFSYYPAYILATNKHQPFSYLQDYFSNQGWPAGPAWFVWVLFVFTTIMTWGVWIFKRRKDRLPGYTFECTTPLIFWGIFAVLSCLA